MFQTFSGNSRRPRQVNLSGQNPDPFVSNAWGSTGSGTKQTVASAQQERQLRQQEREKLNASKRIQRTWRGHKARRELADLWRVKWDEAEASGSPETVLAEQLRLLVNFYSPRRPDDLNRLTHISHKILDAGCSGFLASQEVQLQLPRLATVCLEALIVSLPSCPDALLKLLVEIIERRPDTFSKMAVSYYSYLSKLFTSSVRGNLDKELVVSAIKVPLVEHVDYENSRKHVLEAYTHFGANFLTTPNLYDLLGGSNELAAVIDIALLSATLSTQFSKSADHIPIDNRLWLLANFVCLHRQQQRSSQEPEYLRALSLQLSSSSSEIVSRIDSTELSAHTADDGREIVAIRPLPPFVQKELHTLVDKASISGLLAKFNIDYAKSSSSGEEDASLLASYALTLLRIFPRRSDEIRMWLYLGSMMASDGKQVPALKFFWQAVRSTNIFSGIRADSKSALSLLRPQTQSAISQTGDITKDREWRTILLFLELYTFVLRFTDDEEFLSPSTINIDSDKGPVSRIRESALPLEDVKQLTVFLKNLAFTMYYNAGELSDDGHHVLEGGLGSYFGTSAPSRFRSPEPVATSRSLAKRPFAGIAGVTFNYVRTVVTGVLRVLYERDSRRRFLPKDHWLMTSRFEMEGFIPAVVMEEERQHQVTEDGEDIEPDDIDDVEINDRMGLIGMSRPRRAQQIEVMRRAQQQASRQKMLAAVGPRLEVLQNMPFVIPFETRVQIFRQFVLLDQTRRRGGNVDPDIWRMAIMQQAQMQPSHNRTSGHELLGRHHAKIRRDQIFQDAYEQFYELGEGLKEPIQITFVDQFDTVEAGIDGGGVTKEFLTSITNEALRSGHEPNLFTSNDQNLLYPNPSALDERRELLRQAGLSDTDIEWRESIKDLLRQYEFLGRVVGKCLYEGILVDIGFAGFFLLRWAASGAAASESGGYRANINDLRDLDEGLYQGLLKLKNYPGNVEDFGLDFTITDTISYAGAPTLTIERDLMPNGSTTTVTNENRPLYVSYVARHRLQVQPYQQTQAFLRGLGDIIKPSWLSMFNQSELQTLIGGDASEIDVDDLRRNTQYGGVYQIGDDGEEHSTIKLFWRVLKDLDDEDRRKLLKYVTSTPRAPLLGFSQLNPRFSIRDAGGDEERLPSTSTCVNLLKLPRYSTASTLKKKLLYAVNSGAGFDLS